MKQLTSIQLRKIWLDFWTRKQHKVAASKSLIPYNDPTLLWINSGIATLKDYFSGLKIPKNKRITNIQKCIRTNDIENVGLTSRHQTFFEMMGNFSIGDYFKEEAIEWAHEFLFDELEFEKEKIYITYFKEDQDTYQKWIQLGIAKDHLIAGDRDMNFWDIGRGPCGPDTEIFYDRGEKYDEQGKGIELLEKDLENDRYIEIWNIVFSEFNNDGNKNYTPLAQKNIDTGAGFERLVSIIQDVPTNFDSDLFLPIIKEVEKLVDHKYIINNYFEKNQVQKKINYGFKVIADHIRAAVMSINDGEYPSNTQRGYIIRRLIRIAYMTGKNLGIKEDEFLYKLTATVAKILPIYEVNIPKVQNEIQKEEQIFKKTIKQGMEILDKEISKTKNNVFDFGVAFNLYETYGFPIQLTQMILKDKGIELDIAKMDQYKAKHSQVSRGKNNIKGMNQQINIIQEIKGKKSEFVGYSQLHVKGTEVIFQGKEHDKYFVLLKETPFYATGGGQEKDLGTINNNKVLDIFKDKHGNHWHVLEQKLASKTVDAIVNDQIRLLKERNHSGTHLLGFALRKVFGNEVKQKGSNNNENGLRFDFSLSGKPTQEDIEQVEKIIKDYIAQDVNREYIVTPYKKAIELGAVALEGETYQDEVRVVKFNDAVELCGGTHLKSAGEIENFKILKVESKGSHTFRIEAVTGNEKVAEYENSLKTKLINEIEKVATEIIKKHSKYEKPQFNLSHSVEQLQSLLEKIKKDKKSLDKQNKKVEVNLDEIKFQDYNGMQTYINLSVDASKVKSLAIHLRNEFPDHLIIIGSQGSKILAVASNKYDAKSIFQEIAKRNNGKGGGNDNFAMGPMKKLEIN